MTTHTRTSPGHFNNYLSLAEPSPLMINFTTPYFCIGANTRQAKCIMVMYSIVPIRNYLLPMTIKKFSILPPIFISRNPLIFLLLRKYMNTFLQYKSFCLLLFSAFFFLFEALLYHCPTVVTTPTIRLFGILTQCLRLLWTR